MKNILLLVHDDNGQEARLQAALDVTRAIRGHLTCLHVTEYGPAIGADPYGMSGAVMLLSAERQIESEHRERIEKRLSREDVPFDWVEVMSGLEAAIREASDLADLIVLNSEMSKQLQPQVYRLAERLAVKSGKPILAAAAEQGFRPADPVLVAWDGSDPASAAIRAAVPLLELSESVTIFHARTRLDDADAHSAAEYLSRHGVHAQVVEVDVRSKGLVEALLLSNLESGCFGWAVMGAFSKSRFREALFGGTTKRMLKESPVPLLIAH